MDYELIEKFRDVVNSDSYIRKKYSEGKINLWNCICSAMDWISVSITDFSLKSSIPPFGSDDELTWEIFLIISKVSSIKGAIEQLHRVFYDGEPRCIYLDKDRTVWGGNQFKATDNQYFEMLRACFGTHSVNLHDLYKDGRENPRFFASWPICDNGEFYVTLYPNSSGLGENWLKITLDLHQLEHYANLRYDHLKDIIELIESQKATDSFPPVD